MIHSSGVLTVMCFDCCNWFGPKNKRKRAPKKKKTETTKTSFQLYGTNWQDNVGIDPDISPSKIEDANFARDVPVRLTGEWDRIDLYEIVLSGAGYPSSSWQIERIPLGKGGYGSVYKLSHRTDGRVYALKVMKLKSKNDTKGADFLTFKHEVFALRKISHRNIIEVIDHFLVSDKPLYLSFMILELAIGGDLNRRLRAHHRETKEAFSEAEAHKYFAQIANAIQFVHSKRIAHRDLKLDNILITVIDGQEVVKVTDFGCARVAVKNEDIVMSQVAVGTIIYMAPEVLKVYLCANKQRPELIARPLFRYNPFKADVWSLGICLYRMLTFEFPYRYKQKGTQQELIESLHLMIKSQKLAPKQPNVSQKCINLLTELLEYHKDRRIIMDSVIRHQWVVEMADDITADRTKT